MLLKHRAEIFRVGESTACGHIEHRHVFQQQRGSLFQADESHEFLRCLAGECLQSAIEQRTAHGHLTTKMVHVKVLLTQMVEHRLGGPVDEGLVSGVERYRLLFGQWLLSAATLWSRVGRIVSALR